MDTPNIGVHAAVAVLALALCPALAPAQQDKLDAGIPHGEGQAAIFVRMKDQILKTGSDFARYCEQHENAKRRALRAEVLAELKSRSDASWKKVEKLVASLGDGVRSLRRYWVVNGFACVATGAACRELAKHDAVGFVYNKPRRVPALHRVERPTRPRLVARNEALAKRALSYLEAAAGSKLPPPEKLTPTWNLERIRAVDAWKTGAFGQGITTALLDSGLLVTPALSQALWRNPKEQLDGKDDDGDGYVDDLFGYDFANRTGISIGDPRFPCHGSICGGIVAGRPVKVDGKLLVTGVAPKSRLMVLRGMGLLESYEYALDHGADIVSMSYMWVGIELGNWRGLYRLAHEHMTIAGIVSVGGSGNFGTKAKNGKQICLPKDIPCVISASGLDENGRMPAFSSLGPCTWAGVRFYDDFPAAKPLQKPDVTTFITGFPCWTNTRRIPRQWKKVHVFGGNVGLVVGPRGNSFSGPHAGGVAALMLSANPDLPAWRVKELMEATCKDLGPKGRDTKFGAGSVDALAAVKAARAAAK